MFNYKLHNMSYDLYFNQEYKIEYTPNSSDYSGYNLEKFRIQAFDFFYFIKNELRNLESMVSSEEERLNWDFTDQQVEKGFKQLFKKYFFNTNVVLKSAKREMAGRLFENYREHLLYLKTRHENNLQIILDWLSELPDTLDNLLDELYNIKAMHDELNINNKYIVNDSTCTFYKEIEIETPNMLWAHLVA